MLVTVISVSLESSSTACAAMDVVVVEIVASDALYADSQFVQRWVRVAVTESVAPQCVQVYDASESYVGCVWLLPVGGWRTWLAVSARVWVVSSGADSAVLKKPFEVPVVGVAESLGRVCTGDSTTCPCSSAAAFA